MLYLNHHTHSTHDPAIGIHHYLHGSDCGLDSLLKLRLIVGSDQSSLLCGTSYLLSIIMVFIFFVFFMDFQRSILRLDSTAQYRYFTGREGCVSMRQGVDPHWHLTLLDLL